MLKKLSIFLAGAALVAMTAGSAFATEIKDNGYEDSLQEILNNITKAPNPGVSSVDALGVTNDALVSDQYWRLTGSGGSVNSFIAGISGNSNNNSIGIYDRVGNMVTLFSGTQPAGSQLMVSIKADGSVKINNVDTGIDFVGDFGYFLNTGTNTWYSDSSLNSDNADHMVAFQGTNTDTIQIPTFNKGVWTNNEYVLAFEDANGLGDKDYQDFIFMAESVAPVPEPGTMVLLGAGMLGLVIFGKRRMNRE